MDGTRLVVIRSMEGGKSDEASEVEEYREALEEMEERLVAEGLEARVRRRVLGNTPAEDLAAVAAKEDAALPVVGYRRRTPPGEFFLGSDAQDILLVALWPVLMVSPES